MTYDAAIFWLTFGDADFKQIFQAIKCVDGRGVL
jgi:hypothetical protein